jgi:hypothetical protein
MFVHIGIFLYLTPLCDTGTFQQLVDCVSLVHFIQLASIIADVFEIEPGVQEQTYDAYAREEKGAPKKAVA